MYQYQCIGMHLLWWAFWLMLIIPFFLIATPVRRRTVHLYRANPVGILERRYAGGEIKTEEYEDRKSRIECDMRDPQLRSLSPSASDRNATALSSVQDEDGITRRSELGARDQRGPSSAWPGHPGEHGQPCTSVVRGQQEAMI